MRINKFISRCAAGLSRRMADDEILAGNIVVNGEVVKEFSFSVDIEKDLVLWKGKKLEIKKEEVFVFYKPRGCLTARISNDDKKTIYDYLPEKFKNFMPIGRLDFNSEGLLLMTNSGELKRKMELPENKVPRIYKVRVDRKLEKKELLSLERGVSVEGVVYKAEKVRIIDFQQHHDVAMKDRFKRNVWLEITLLEGKNREIRKMMQYFDIKVSRLIRTNYGDYKL